MKKTLRSYLPWVAIVLVFSCADPQPNEFLHFSERLIETQPENALILLHGMDRNGLSAEDYARWCLDITQAQDKVDASHTSDTIIRHAVRYYERHRNLPHLIRSYYYMGRVAQELQNAPVAQEYYLKAINLGEAANDTLQLSLACNQLGMLYTYQYAYGDAQTFLDKSLQYLQLLKDTASQAYVLRNMARNYGLMDSLERSVECYKEALCLADVLSRTSILTELGERLIEMKRYDTAYVYLRQAVDSADVEDYTVASLHIGRYFVESNKSDSAKQYLLNATTSSVLQTRLAAYFYLARLARDSYRYQDYFKYQTRYELLRDTFEFRLHTQKMVEMQSLYNYHKIQQLASKVENQRNKAVRNTLLITIVTMFIALCFAAYFVMIQIKLRRDTLEQKMIFERFKASSADMTQEQVRLNVAAIEKLTEKKEEDKKNIANIEYEIQLLELSNLLILKKLEEQEQAEKEFIESELFLRIYNDKKLSEINSIDLDQIMEMIDKLYPFFKLRLTQTLSITSYEDFCICYLIKVKVKKSYIAKILKLSRQAINNRCRKLASDSFGDESTHAVLEQVIKSL